MISIFMRELSIVISRAIRYSKNVSSKAYPVSKGSYNGYYMVFVF